MKWKIIQNQKHKERKNWKIDFLFIFLLADLEAFIFLQGFYLIFFYVFMENFFVSIIFVLFTHTESEHLRDENDGEIKTFSIYL